MFAAFPRLAERQWQCAGTLSGGEQQMLAIGRGLMAEPQLLILDEPSLGLSPRLVEELFALITAIHAQGTAVLLVEQNVVQSLQVAQRAYIVDNGRFVLEGPAADIADDSDLRRAYLETRAWLGQRAKPLTRAEREETTLRRHRLIAPLRRQASMDACRSACGMHAKLED